MPRIDYHDDPAAPAANSLVPGGSAIVTDDRGAVLLLRRGDTGRWALPGGTMDIGERLADAVVRETREETGLEVRPVRIVGIYSDPRHVFAYDDGEVRQEFNVCLACELVGGEVTTSPEAPEVRFFPPAELERLDMHPSIRLRLRHFLERREPYLG
jgi:ADP-ribose pyrophosphatase YjhB (NUDIX family)